MVLVVKLLYKYWLSYYRQVKLLISNKKDTKHGIRAYDITVSHTRTKSSVIILLIILVPLCSILYHWMLKNNVNKVQGCLYNKGYYFVFAYILLEKL